MHSYFLLLFILSTAAFGQSDSAHKPITGFVETGLSISTPSQTPFWLRAKQYGIVPDQNSFDQLRAGFYRNYSQPVRKLDWGLGVEAVVNIGQSRRFIIPEFYVKGRLGVLELMAGRRRKVVGLADTLLGVGPMAWSGNALPIPEIQISLPDYVPLGFTKGLIAFKGFYSHGWFDNRGPVKGSFLHQKAFYGRFGKPNWSLKLYAGFNHQVQWGGRSDVFTSDLVIKNGRFPTSLADYFDIISGTSLGAKEDTDTSRISKGDRENRIGNHLGTIDLGAEWTGKSFTVWVYRQSYYEDGSLFYLINIADGLNGIRIRQSGSETRGFQIRELVAEFLYTLSQGGPTFGNLPAERGADNYFNHTQYIDGWSYGGRGIGTPFIGYYGESRSELPTGVKASYTNGDYHLFTNNNRVRVLHMGMAGTVGTRFTFRMFCSLSDNLGSYAIAFPKNTRQLSTLLSVSAPLKGKPDWIARVTIAVDRGKLLPNSTGIYFSLRKTWGFAQARFANTSTSGF
ncbi:capsule assembly Wzi family protein [Spirosoma endbachense]|uniref:Capsule assembly Wzi family protein n=1 Tax=Spirosoma endbachense TaxID=2666025 RepID=A0A6P1W094_9BACT|nr:capsule assembly Wzi family protein [Spirosoma endbachense]QHV98314.1 hypothetical protein GJR95_26410 [Spirosoma endbachense]